LFRRQVIKGVYAAESGSGTHVAGRKYTGNSVHANVMFSTNHPARYGARDLRSGFR